MARVTKDTMIGELLQIDANVAPMLLNIGTYKGKRCVFA